MIVALVGFSVGKRVKNNEDILHLFDGCWRNGELKRLMTPILSDLLSKEPSLRPTSKQLVNRLRETFPKSVQVIDSMFYIGENVIV